MQTVQVLVWRAFGAGLGAAFLALGFVQILGAG
jgi:hypothetical protein